MATMKQLRQGAASVSGVDHRVVVPLPALFSAPARVD